MKPSVMIVDDSLTVRMDLVEAFESAGFRVLPCATAAEARVALAAEVVGLIVLDLLLPDADGFDLLQEIRLSSSRSVPVMLLSTEAEVQHRMRGLRTGADEYVGKPYDTSYVISRARELLRKGHDGAPEAAATVLIIDDSPTFCEEIRCALQAEGYEVLVAGTGEEGLRIAADARPSAILVDSVLPGISGATVVRHIRLDVALRQTPCLFLTASEEQHAEISALEAGADGFAQKSDLAIILARLAAMMRGGGPRVETRNTASLLGPKKILAVDDSLTYLHGLASALHGEGYDLVLAHSGEEALELLSAQSVDCILLDLLMPGLSGEETCRRIKSASGLRDTPIIMLTGLDDRDAMLRGLNAGADDYISKSSDLEVLRARVRTQFRRRQFEDENCRFREQLVRMELEAAEARAASELAETKAALTEELKRKNRELEAFSYSVSHDLRAPLRVMDGYSQALLEDYSDKLGEQGKEYLLKIRAGAKRLSALVNDLLELSRVTQAELCRETVDLSALAGAVAAELQRSAPERPVRVLIQEGLTTEGDPRLLRVALENILGNAWKFTGHAAEPFIEFGASESQGQTVYFVRDNGAGFDMKFASKLFVPFQRLHSESEFPGTGVGLATVYRIVDRHRGRVWAEGEVGRGATVRWTLPPKRSKMGRAVIDRAQRA